MRLLPKPEISPFEAHPEHGFDWKAYRAMEDRMIKRGEFRPLSDIHQAVDEDLLMEAYDSRAMRDLEARMQRERAAQSPPRLVERSGAPAANSPRQILADPEFSGRQPKGGGNPWAIAAMLMMDPVPISQDTWDPKYYEGPPLYTPWRRK